jgi:hypothetical protein
VKPPQFAICIGLILTAGCALAADTEKTNSLPDAKTEAKTQTHWSLMPVLRPDAPQVTNPKWKPRNPIDNFVYAKLAESKLSPSPEANRRVLLRRVYFDLVGLPPSPAEVAAFEADKSANAYEKVVEQLLASPHYGERWARHWLDVVRFAETHGFEMNQPRTTAYLYRDYVIAALNQDKPYDRFVLEQFAGDVLGEDAATGFLVGGPWDQVKSPDPVLTAAQRADELHDMVSTASSTFLALTVGCARCHNHKFDPIPQKDYYAMKACLAGVQHGERALHTPEAAAREQEANQEREKLAQVEMALEKFEPMAFSGRMLLVEPEPSFGSHLVETFKRTARVNYSSGGARGEKDDAGEFGRLPNLSHSYLAWSNAANADVFACKPGVTGRFHLWISWGCGQEAYAKDACFLVDRDGDLSTTNDQTQIALVDERHFTDGTGDATNKSLWSGFLDAGVLELSISNAIVLRGGGTDAPVTVANLALIEERAGEAAEQARPSAARAPAVPRFLRASVNPRRNVERFAPAKAKRLRFTITKTTDAEPCLDELEVYTSGANPKNIALASLGTKPTASGVYPNSDIHRIEHINDGKLGNSHSWISNESGKGWIELEFPEEAVIDRIVWGRDREQKFSDRLSLEYRVEVATGSSNWTLVASSQDRLPYSANRPSPPDFRTDAMNEHSAHDLKELLTRRTALDKHIEELSNGPMVYAGKMTEKPDPTHRLQRGDPMQEREVIEPAGLSAIGLPFPRGDSLMNVSGIGTQSPNPNGASGAMRKELTEDQQRRLGLAEWITNPDNPLPARVMVNRLWQHHFGQGLVTTPSDFGKNGAKPSHPELLDWLASEFKEPQLRQVGQDPHGWSIKHIQRLIVTSATYRQASESRAEAVAVDAGSRLLWRFPPQRLEAEPIRDTILTVSGKLDSTPGGPGFSCFQPNDNYVRVYEPRKEFGPPEWRRMIYMTKVRMQQDSTFGAFDCPDGGQIAPKRMRSTTPLQALNLFNSEFMFQQAGFFSDRLIREAGSDLKAQVRLAFELAFSRDPDTDELSAAQKLIAQNGLLPFCRAIFNSNEFIFSE